MINKVSFMGREECLTAGLKNAAKKTEYFAPRSPIGEIKKTTTAKENIVAKTTADLNEAYKAAHAPYVQPKAKPTEVVTDGQVL